MDTNTNVKPILPRGKFLGMVTMIAMPIMVQSLISTLVNVADTVMLGFVSQEAMSASSLANQITTLLWLALNGIISGGCVLVSQYWGKKDLNTIERIMGFTIRFSMMIAIAFFAASFFFPEFLMRIFSPEEAIIKEGVRYLRIVSVSFLFMGFSQAYLAILRSMEKAILPSVTYFVSLGVNVLLNATFIFGLFGAPKLGLAGVAIGTVTARVVEVIFCVIHAIFAKQVRFRFRYLFAKNKILMKDFVKISLPSLVNEVVWSLAFSMYSVILGHLGSDAVAANAVAQMVLNIGAIVARGFANAATVVIGKTLGEGNEEATKIYARRLTWIIIAVCIGGGLVIIGLRPVAIAAYMKMDKLTETAIAYAGAMLLMQSYHLLGEGLNTLWICGCFRGGGDTRFGMILDCVFMWAVAVPLMAAAAFLLKLPVEWVYFVMCLDEFLKMPIVYIHYKKMNWLKNITREESELA